MTVSNIRESSKSPVNILINGGFDTWQRGTSVQVTGFASNYSADRWSFTINASGSPTVTATQSSLVPDASTKYSIKYLVSVNAATSITEIAARQRIETQDVMRFVGNRVTLSFWYYSNITGDHAVRLGLDANNSGAFSNHSPFLFNYPVANVWQKITQTFDNFVLHNFGTQTPESGGVFLDIGPAAGGIGKTSLSVGDYWHIAKAQLEPGSAATQFKPYGGLFGEELRACHRYYYNSTYKAYGDIVFRSWNTSTGAGNLSLQIPFPTTMRANPTVQAFVDINDGAERTPDQIYCDNRNYAWLYTYVTAGQFMDVHRLILTSEL